MLDDLHEQEMVAFVGMLFLISVIKGTSSFLLSNCSPIPDIFKT